MGKNHKVRSVIPVPVVQQAIVNPVEYINSLVNKPIGETVQATRALLDEVMRSHVALAESVSLAPAELGNCEDPEMQSGPITILRRLYSRILAVLKSQIDESVKSLKTESGEILDNVNTTKDLAIFSSNKVRLHSIMDQLYLAFPLLTAEQKSQILESIRIFTVVNNTAGLSSRVLAVLDVRFSKLYVELSKENALEKGMFEAFYLKAAA